VIKFQQGQKPVTLSSNPKKKKFAYIPIFGKEKETSQSKRPKGEVNRCRCDKGRSKKNNTLQPYSEEKVPVKSKRGTTLTRAWEKRTKSKI